MLSVNTKMLDLYWRIGTDILAKQEERGWGAKVINQLSKDLSTKFPEDKGYSVTNLKYMRGFASNYPDFLPSKISSCLLKHWSVVTDLQSSFFIYNQNYEN